jgi:hypothetical protein
MAVHDVLVLNSNYEPLNVCNARRAISLLILGKADVLVHRDDPIYTAGDRFRNYGFLGTPFWLVISSLVSIVLVKPRT